MAQSTSKMSTIPYVPRSVVISVLWWLQVSWDRKAKDNVHLKDQKRPYA